MATKVSNYSTSQLFSQTLQYCNKQLKIWNKINLFLFMHGISIILILNTIPNEYVVYGATFNEIVLRIKIKERKKERKG